MKRTLLLTMAVAALYWGAVTELAFGDMGGWPYLYQTSLKVTIACPAGCFINVFDNCKCMEPYIPSDCVSWGPILDTSANGRCVWIMPAGGWDCVT